MIKLVEKIVFSNINGVIMIPALIWTLCVIVGQARETVEIFKEVE
jgi:hypothetical protein